MKVLLVLSKSAFTLNATQPEAKIGEKAANLRE